MIKKILFYIVIGIGIIGLYIGGFYFSRWFNWKFSYKGFTKKEISEIVKRVDVLEKRVERLEK